MHAGQRLGPYEILSPLGVGGMGEVYKARDTRLHRIVAVKVLSAHLAKDAQLKQRFEREARAVASLNHPHICVLHDVGSQDDIEYLVMEYLEGDTLAAHLDKNGPLPPELTLRYSIQIADALDKAHRQGITHRDLKPSNIMLTKSGAKLLDFGLSKATKSVIGSTLSVAPTELTTTGSLMGTFQYMAPEQLEGKPADHRSDIFAYGAVLYEMAEGRRAFDTNTQAKLIAAIMEKDPPPLTQLQHPALDQVVRHCMEKNPDDRFQSARDIVVTLQSMSLSNMSLSSNPQLRIPISGLPLGSPSTHIKGPLPAPERRIPLSWIVAAACVVVALGALAIVLLRAAPPVEWTGSRLGGPAIAMGPRVSPDGKTLAFAAMVDGQTQLAVMAPNSGNWTVLTSERTLGEIDHFSWSPDSGKIYFDRSVARAIFSIPALGGESRKVLEDAVFPEALADGTLLAVRTNANGLSQLHHLHPESGKFDALPVIADVPDGGLRAFPNGREAVLFGAPDNSASGKAHDPYALLVVDIATGQTRRIAKEVNFHSEELTYVPVGVSADSKTVFTAARSGDSFKVYALPADGSAPAHSLLTLTTRVWNLDAGPDGSLYIDQVDRPTEVVGFSANPSSGVPEKLAGFTGPLRPALALPDGRILVGSTQLGHDRLLVLRPGKDPQPFVDTTEETSPPMAMVGAKDAVFMTAKDGMHALAIASVADGRILTRLPAQKDLISSVAASPDGATIYYCVGGTVWATSLKGAADGARKVTTGDRVAISGRGLIVQRKERGGARLYRVNAGSSAASGTASGGASGGDVAIPIAPDVTIVETSLAPNAVDSAGRILITATSPDSWFLGATLIDPDSGKATRLAADYPGDIFYPSWIGASSRVLASGVQVRSALWRFVKGD